MEIDKIQCLVTLAAEGTPGMTQVVMAGPSALSAPEVVLMRAKNDVEDICCISDAIVVDTVETSFAHERERLSEKYGRSIVHTIFPAAHLMPKTLMQLDLPPEAVCDIIDAVEIEAEPPVVAKPAASTAKPKEAPAVVAARKRELKAQLEAAGVKLPKGKHTEDDLKAMVEEAGLTEAA